jgi:penicillin-insensitive murein endopeptidase
MYRVLLAALPLAVALLGCVGEQLPGAGVVSWGTPSDGRILGRGASLDDRGPGFVRARPGEETRFGTPALVDVLTRAAADVARRFPGTIPIRLGDLSAPGGGRHSRHHSHRSGRDADGIYYALDEYARPTDGAGFYAYDRFGVARDARPVGEVGEDVAALAPAARPVLRYLDAARNWAFFRVLLRDDTAPVEWIFCSAGIKSQVLAYAIAHEPDPELLVRAAYVLQQPTDGRPHDDHFHVRLACTATDRASGCRDVGPMWPWLRDEHEKPITEGGAPMDDAFLLDALLRDEPGGPALAAE